MLTPSIIPQNPLGPDLYNTDPFRCPDACENEAAPVLSDETHNPDPVEPEDAFTPRENRFGKIVAWVMIVWVLLGLLLPGHH